MSNSYYIEGGDANLKEQRLAVYKKQLKDIDFIKNYYLKKNNKHIVGKKNGELLMHLLESGIDGYSLENDSINR
jgi:hypothetical protein